MSLIHATKDGRRIFASYSCDRLTYECNGRQKTNLSFWCFLCDDVPSGGEKDSREGESIGNVTFVGILKVILVFLVFFLCEVMFERFLCDLWLARSYMRGYTPVYDATKMAKWSLCISYILIKFG